MVSQSLLQILLQSIMQAISSEVQVCMRGFPKDPKLLSSLQVIIMSRKSKVSSVGFL